MSKDIVYGTGEWKSYKLEFPEGKLLDADTSIVKIASDSVDFRIDSDQVIFSIDGKETLKLTPEGFYLNGRIVDVGDTYEHQIKVYRAFKRFVSEAIKHCL